MARSAYRYWSKSFSVGGVQAFSANPLDRSTSRVYGLCVETRCSVPRTRQQDNQETVMATSTARPQASKPENRGSNYEKRRLMRVGSLRDLREETGQEP